MGGVGAWGLPSHTACGGPDSFCLAGYLRSSPAPEGIRPRSHPTRRKIPLLRPPAGPNPTSSLLELCGELCTSPTSLMGFRSPWNQEVRGGKTGAQVAEGWTLHS